MTLRSVLASAGCGLLVVMALAGCVAGDEPAESTDETAEQESDGVWTVVNAAADTEYELVVSQWRLRNDCMEDKGFDVHMEKPEPAAQPMASRAPADEALLPSLEQARQDGLGIGEERRPGYEPEEDDGPPPSEFDEMPGDYTDRYLVELQGSDVTFDEEGRASFGGCTAEVSTQLFGEPNYEIPVPQAFDPQRQYEAYELEPALVAAQSDWSDCMSGGTDNPGFADVAQAKNYANYLHYPLGSKPEEGPVPQGGPFPFEQARELEIELAIAMVECGDEVGINDIHRQAWESAIDTLVDESEEEIYSWSEAMSTALKKAQELLKT